MSTWLIERMTSLSAVLFDMEGTSLIGHLLDLLVQILNDLRLFELRRAGIQKPRFGIVRFAHREERRLHFKVDLQRVLIARGKGVALDLVVQRRREYR